MSLDFKAVDYDLKTERQIHCSGSARSRTHSGISIDLERPNAAIPYEEFCEIIRYFMENTDLSKDDPRLKLIEDLKKAKLVVGYNGGTSLRIDLPR